MALTTMTTIARLHRSSCCYLFGYSGVSFRTIYSSMWLVDDEMGGNRQFVVQTIDNVMSTFYSFYFQRISRSFFSHVCHRQVADFVVVMGLRVYLLLAVIESNQSSNKINRLRAYVLQPDVDLNIDNKSTVQCIRYKHTMIHNNMITKKRRARVFKRKYAPIGAQSPHCSLFLFLGLFFLYLRYSTYMVPSRPRGVKKHNTVLGEIWIWTKIPIP